MGLHGYQHSQRPLHSNSAEEETLSSYYFCYLSFSLVCPSSPLLHSDIFRTSTVLFNGLPSAWSYTCTTISGHSSVSYASQSDRKCALPPSLQLGHLTLKRSGNHLKMSIVQRWHPFLILKPQTQIMVEKQKCFQKTYTLKYIHIPKSSVDRYMSSLASHLLLSLR